METIHGFWLLRFVNIKLTTAGDYNQALCFAPKRGVQRNRHNACCVSHAMALGGRPCETVQTLANRCRWWWRWKLVGIFPCDKSIHWWRSGKRWFRTCTLVGKPPAQSSSDSPGLFCTKSNDETIVTSVISRKSLIVEYFEVMGNVWYALCYMLRRAKALQAAMKTKVVVTIF